MIIKTKQLADMCGVRGIELRRVLRSMPRYDDGVQTHYVWDDVSDAAILSEIKAKVAAYTAKRAPVAAAPEVKAEVAAILSEVATVAAETVALPATLPSGKGKNKGK